MPAVQLGQTYHHRRAKDSSCQIFVALSPTTERVGTKNYVLYSQTQPIMLRHHLSPQSWHIVEECPYA